MGVLQDVGVWLFRLLPGNPILIRVVSAAGKRSRHFWARVIFLGALFAVFLMSGGLLKESGSLVELAKQSTQTFMYVSVVQLLMMSFIAPVFCAGAITQEKDANTFHILLTTPLSNGQIVLGSLFSRLYFVWVLLLSGLPIFCITMIYGGVTTAEVFESFGLAACTGLITGSVAIMISFLKVGTRRTIFSFFVGIAVYLIGVGWFGLSPWGQLSVAPSASSTMIGAARMSWLAPIHPFLALLVVTGQTPAPAPAEVFQFGWPARWLLAHPQYGYMAITTLASALMVLVSLVYVRRGARDSESALMALLRQIFARGEQRRKPRRVGNNPIAWREANTRASAGGRSAIRWLFAAAGLVAGVLLLGAHYNGWGPLKVTPGGPPPARAWLTGLIWIEAAVTLLMVTSTAASALTREKESQSMEILLTTPLTSKLICWGLLSGLIWFIWPLLAAPTITIALFAAADLLQGSASPVVAPEAALFVPLLLTAFASLAAIIGLQFSLSSRKTAQAIMLSTGVVLLLAGVTWGCGQAVISGAPATLASVAMPFLPFPAMQALLDPWHLVTIAQASQSYGVQMSGPPSAAAIDAFRVTAACFTLVSTALYATATYLTYRAMVRNFNMTVRRQAI